MASYVIPWHPVASHGIPWNSPVLRAAEPTLSSNGLARCSGVVSLLAVGVASGWRRRRGPLCAVRDCEPLLEWLKEMPATEGLDGLRIGQSTYEAGGLGVFAAKDFAAGELVCLWSQCWQATGDCPATQLRHNTKFPP
eukprot:symbB.v1.2.000556.t1/scaffold19.1/size443072/20